jgi:hypothetical protein
MRSLDAGPRAAGPCVAAAHAGSRSVIRDKGVDACRRTVARGGAARIVAVSDWPGAPSVVLRMSARIGVSLASTPC